MFFFDFQDKINSQWTSGESEKGQWMDNPLLKISVLLINSISNC